MPASSERLRLALVEQTPLLSGDVRVLASRERPGRRRTSRARRSRWRSGAASVSQLRKPSSKVSTAVRGPRRAPRRAAPPRSGSGSRGPGGSGRATRGSRGAIRSRAGSPPSRSGRRRDRRARPAVAAGGRSSERARQPPAEPPRRAGGREAHQRLVAVVALQPQADQRAAVRPCPAGAGCAGRPRSRGRWPSRRPGTPRRGRRGPSPRSRARTDTRLPRPASPSTASSCVLAARELLQGGLVRQRAEIRVRDGVRADLDPGRVQRAELRRRSRSASTAADRCGWPSQPETTKTVAGAPSLREQRRERLGVVHEAVVERERRVARRLADAAASRASSPNETSR